MNKFRYVGLSVCLMFGVYLGLQPKAASATVYWSNVNLSSAPTDVYYGQSAGFKYGFTLSNLEAGETVYDKLWIGNATSGPDTDVCSSQGNQNQSYIRRCSFVMPHQACFVWNGCVFTEKIYASFGLSPDYSDQYFQLGYVNIHVPYYPLLQ